MQNGGSTLSLKNLPHGSLDLVVNYLNLSDLTLLSSVSKTFKVHVDELVITNVDLDRLAKLSLKQVYHLFCRIADYRLLRSVNLTVDPFNPQRALLLTILRALTKCQVHDLNSPDYPEFAGYYSSVKHLEIRTSTDGSSIPIGYIQRTHAVFRGYCEDDQIDELRFYCVCVDWSKTCHHPPVRRKMAIGPHRNWMCWLLKDDWYNVFRWFPHLETLRVPLGYYKNDYAPVLEFKIPKLIVKNGTNRGSCHHPLLQELSLSYATDYTLIADVIECQRSACKLRTLKLGCLNVSRRSLGKFVRCLLYSEVRCDGALVVHHLRELSIYSTPYDASTISAGISSRSSFSSVSSVPASPFSEDSDEVVELVPNSNPRPTSWREQFCKLALAFSTIVSATPDAEKLCDSCASGTCRAARIRSYAPLIFKCCETLSIDVCSLLAQEDLPNAFPTLQNLSCTFWVCGDPWIDEIPDYKTHFSRRLIDLLARLRTIVRIEIQQDFSLPTDRTTYPKVSFLPKVGQYLVQSNPSPIRSRENLLRKDFHNIIKSYQSIWVVLPVRHPEDLPETSPELLLVPYHEYRGFVQDRIYFTIIATGSIQ